MMRASHKPFAAFLLALAVAGCTSAPVTPPRRQEVSDADQVRALLESFEQGVRNDDVPLIMSLYSPSLPPKDMARERRRVARAVRSFRYSEYELLKKAELPAKALRDGKLKLELQFTKPEGKVGDDVFCLRRESGRWYLVSVGLEKPQEGDNAHLAPEERDKVVKTIAQCNQAILSGDLDALVGELGSDLSEKKRIDVKKGLVELLKLHKYQYFSSNFSRSALEVTFAGKGDLAVPLDFMYVRHDGSRGERKLGFRLRRINDNWQLIDIDRRDNPFWKNFGKIAAPFVIFGAAHAASMAF